MSINRRLHQVEIDLIKEQTKKAEAERLQIESNIANDNKSLWRFWEWRVFHSKAVSNLTSFVAMCGFLTFFIPYAVIPVFEHDINIAKLENDHIRDTLKKTAKSLNTKDSLLLIRDNQIAARDKDLEVLTNEIKHIIDSIKANETHNINIDKQLENSSIEVNRILKNLKDSRKQYDSTFLETFGSQPSRLLSITRSQAQLKIDRVLKFFNYKRHVEIASRVDISNAMTPIWIENGKWDLIYDPPVIETCYKLSGDNYLFEFMMYHELGHIVLGHMPSNYQDVKFSNEQELAADAFAARCFRVLGYSESTIEPIIKLLAQVPRYNNGSQLPINERISATWKGWRS